MVNRTLCEWESVWADVIKEQCADSAHDFDHVARVVRAAKEIASAEGAQLEVVVPAAWLHDLVSLPKNHPERALASKMSAASACELLGNEGYSSELLGDIGHCIEAHSFSAGIEPRTVEASIVQDADRLDALGAIGIARCFATAGAINRVLYDPDDPWAERRELNDGLYTIDHFEVKLFKIAQTLRTESARKLGRQRAEFMREYLKQLKAEIGTAEQ